MGETAPAAIRARVEGGGPLDAARVAPALKLVFLICVGYSALLGSQEAVRDADEAYARALEFASRSQWEEARSSLIAGLRLTPRDPRFLVELGGVEFKRKRNAEAARWLRRGLRLNASDAYATGFLATLHFLDGNPEAALKYWNRIGKPRLVNVHIEPGLRIDPVLLDRAFTIARGDVIALNNWLDTRARIHGLGVFPSSNLRLEARKDGQFDLRLVAEERNGLGNTKLQAVSSALRGIGFQALQLDWTNLKGSAINGSTLLRWDSQKRRFRSNWSAPLRLEARRRFFMGVDVRDEQWEIPKGRGFPGTSERFGFRRAGLEVGILSVRSAGWTWSISSEVSHRDSQGFDAALPEGFQLKQLLRAERALIYRPERRFESKVTFTSETGRIWPAPSRSFERLESALSTIWFPRWKGDDYRVEQRFGGGGIVGGAPLDELFQLGTERDNALQMRGHVGTQRGRKGNAPIGRRYVLSNSEIDKNLYANGVLKLKLSPFLDCGRIGSRLGGGSSKWLWDTGAQLKVEAMGIGIAVIYGKDLRSGSNSIYVVATR